MKTARRNDPRQTRRGRTHTENKNKKQNGLHAFNTDVFIDIQQDMVKYDTSPVFGETQTRMCTSFVRLLAQLGRREHTKYGTGYWVKVVE